MGYPRRALRTFVSSFYLLGWEAQCAFSAGSIAKIADHMVTNLDFLQMPSQFVDIVALITVSLKYLNGEGENKWKKKLHAKKAKEAKMNDIEEFEAMLEILADGFLQDALIAAREFCGVPRRPKLTPNKKVTFDEVSFNPAKLQFVFDGEELNMTVMKIYAMDDKRSMRIVSFVHDLIITIKDEISAAERPAEDASGSKDKGARAAAKQEKKEEEKKAKAMKEEFEKASSSPPAMPTPRTSEVKAAKENRGASNEPPAAPAPVEQPRNPSAEPPSANNDVLDLDELHLSTSGEAKAKAWTEAADANQRAADEQTAAANRRRADEETARAELRAENVAKGRAKAEAKKAEAAKAAQEPAASPSLPLALLRVDNQLAALGTSAVTLMPGNSPRDWLGMDRLGDEEAPGFPGSFEEDIVNGGVACRACSAPREDVAPPQQPPTNTM
jgi:hypothetical protein